MAVTNYFLFSFLKNPFTLKVIIVAAGTTPLSTVETEYKTHDPKHIQVQPVPV